MKHTENIMYIPTKYVKGTSKLTNVVN